MMLGLIGLLDDNSLVCIDEPEISLHPRWQAEFISIVQRLAAPYYGCHFIIATHSPQIVAGLSANYGYILDLENGLLHDASEYTKRSADFQLAEVFNEPGFKNEYLIRVLLSLLAKITKGQNLSYEDRLLLKQVELIKDRLTTNDPVRHLFDQVKQLSS
ncbi:hypothetical protein VCH24_08010 [Variovorax boronicumulans]|nr:hypothetical protein VCH24_08010 [Variovorax boronicumulans]